MTSIVNELINGESNGDSFGHAISLSSDGSIVAISAPNNEGDLISVSTPIGTITNDTNLFYQTNGNPDWSSDSPTESDYLPAHLKKGINAGSIKVFQNDGSEWVELGNEIKGDQVWDQKGISLSLSGDGKTLVVGNPLSLNSFLSATNPNVSIYSLVNNEWSQITNIQSDSSFDYFGYSTSLSSDGKTLAVGGFYGELGTATDNAGYVKIYENTNGSFSQVGETLYGDDINGDEFGFSVDLSSDGSIAAISSAQGGDVFIYQRSGSNWSQLGSTISFNEYSSDTKPESIRKQEAVVQVKISEDGNYVAIGCPNSDIGGTNNGKIKVFKNTSQNWVQVGADIKGENLNHLGTYIDIEEDSNGFLTLAASGTKENGESYVNVYKLFGSDWISFAGFDSTDNQGFPTSSLDISNNGRFLVTGTSHSPVNSTNYDDNFLSAGYIGYNEEKGNARVYDLNAGIIGTKNEAYSADSKNFASISGSAPVTVTSYEIGQETTLDSIKDYDGNLHAGDSLDATASSYKYQGLLDVNGDGSFETIFTNKSSRRWVTAEVNSEICHINFSDHGQGGSTRVVGIYIDPLVTSGEVEAGSDHDSQRRFQNDLKIDNLIAKHSGDYDSDGIHEVYWKTNDGTAYLRSLMHADGNIRYANYQSEAQMKEYLTANGDDSIIADITS